MAMTEAEIMEEARLRARYNAQFEASTKRTGEDFAKAIKSLDNPVAMLKLSIDGVASAFGNTIKNWQSASDSGAYISKNFVDFGIGLLQAQLSQDDLSRIVQRTGVNFQTLGTTMEGSTKNLLALSNAYSRDTATQNYFKDLGYTVEQANEVIASTAVSTGTFGKAMRGTKVEQDAAMASVIARSKELATEMSALTDITGISRRKQLEEREDQDRDVALQTALGDLPKEQREGFKNITADLQAAGLEKIGRAIFTSEGALSEKEGQFLSLMGSAGPAFNHAMLEYKEALKSGTKDQIDQARIRLTQTRDEAVQVANTPEFKAMVRARGLMGEYSEDILKLRGSTLQLNRIMQENPGMTPTQAMEERKKQLASKEGSGDDASRAGQNLSQTLLGIETIYDQRLVLEADALKVAVKVAAAFTSMEVGKDGKTIKDIVTGGKINANNFEEVLGNILTAVKDINGKSWKEIATAAGDGITDLKTKLVNGLTNLIGNWDPKTQTWKPPEVKRAEGSPGIADFLSGGNNLMSVFENFGAGTPAVLHGMESVIRPEQLNGIINKAAGTAMSSLSGSMQSATSQFAQVNPEVFNDIKSQLAMLNSLMASHLPDISDTMTKQYSAMRDLSPDFHA